MRTYLILFLFATYTLQAQKQYKIQTIGFYNVENLWDTLVSVDIIDGSKHFTNPAYHYNIAADSPEAMQTEKCTSVLDYETLKGTKCKRVQVLDDEFTPKGGTAWDSHKYQTKLNHISKVILQLGIDKSPSPPIAMGLAEIENEHVLKDLIDHPDLKAVGYNYIHFNSYDARGIDVAFLYQPKKFIVEKAIPYVIKIYTEDGNRDYTRDILRVDGFIEGERIHILVNHWPSRRGGETVSMPRRMKAAEKLKEIIEEIYTEEPQAKIIIMGDFNDGPTNASIQSLSVTDRKEKASAHTLFNAMLETSKSGGGTAAYQDSWETLDQLMINYNMLHKELKTYQLLRTEIFKPLFLQEASGQMKGYPFRTYSFGKYTGGYSDHFPIFLQIIKEK